MHRALIHFVQCNPRRWPGACVRPGTPTPTLHVGRARQTRLRSRLLGSWRLQIWEGAPQNGLLRKRRYPNGLDQDPAVGGVYLRVCRWCAEVLGVPLDRHFVVRLRKHLPVSLHHVRADALHIRLDGTWNFEWKIIRHLEGFTPHCGREQ